MSAVAIDLEVLGDAEPLWRQWLVDVGRRARVDATPERLDETLGNWPQLLERYAEERAPVYLRPDAAVSSVIRRLAAKDVAIGVYTELPEPLARVATRQLGVARRLAALETGPGALDRLLARLGPETRVVRSRDELLAL